MWPPTVLRLAKKARAVRLCPGLFAQRYAKPVPARELSKEPPGMPRAALSFLFAAPKRNAIYQPQPPNPTLTPGPPQP
jgi:hypothetical protein